MVSANECSAISRPLSRICNNIMSVVLKWKPISSTSQPDQVQLFLNDPLCGGGLELIRSVALIAGEC